MIVMVDGKRITHTVRENMKKRKANGKRKDGFLYINEWYMQCRPKNWKCIYYTRIYIYMMWDEFRQRYDLYVYNKRILMFVMFGVFQDQDFKWVMKTIGITRCVRININTFYWALWDTMNVLRVPTNLLY